MFANRMHLTAFALALSICGALQASERNAPHEVSYGVPQSVSEMLRIDAERALLTEQKMLAEAQSKFGGGTLTNGILPGAEPVQEVEQPKTAPLTPPVRLEVLGIFGLGDSLLADVAIDNARVRFKRGKRFPLGAGANFPYQLVSIKIPCVKLIDAGKTEHNVCLSNSGL